MYSILKPISLPAAQGLIAGVIVLLSCGRLSWGEEWSGWRGPRGDGTSLETELPTEWDGPATKHLAWKVAIPGQGHSSPVVWGDRVFVTSCLPDSEERILMCLQRDTGDTLWQHTIVKAMLEAKHPLNSCASSTPATDGERIYVAFLEPDGRTVQAPNVAKPRLITPGKVLVAAYNFSGELLWKVHAGEFVSAHGFCSNPVLFEDLVILNGDHDGDAYIVALERATGKERWKVARENKTRSYSTPFIRQVGNRTQMVLSGSKSVVSYDPHNGQPHWSMRGPTDQFVATMVFDGSLFYLTAGFPDHHIMAIKPDGSGDVTDTHVAWRTERGAGYVPSPILVGPYLIVLSDGGVATCFEAQSGKKQWTQRLGDGLSGSPVAANGHAFIHNNEGVCHVIRVDKEYDLIAKNALGERCVTSPAISQSTFFVRGEKHLFAFRVPQ